MAQECMGIFERDKLSDLAGVEQVWEPFHVVAAGDAYGPLE